MKYDCVIIGAGLSGLAAGIRLARAGKKVCICERHAIIGGMNSYYMREGLLLETGLHAMTNFAPHSAPESHPLPCLLHKLDISYDELAPRPQNFSLVSFPGISLHFDNKFNTFKSEISKHFPHQIDGFTKLIKVLDNYREIKIQHKFHSARKVISHFITDPLLEDMLLCPLMFYGSTTEDDMDFTQFTIMFKAIFEQGLFRPAKGIKGLLDLLRNKFTGNGGELRLSTNIIKVETADCTVQGVHTSNGEFIETHTVLSSAGAPETSEMCRGAFKSEPASLAFMEVLVIPRGEPDFSKLPTVTFFCRDRGFGYRPPLRPADLTSGVICFPDNFSFSENDYVPPRMVRTTVLANPHHWFKLPFAEYQQAKSEITRKIISVTEEVTGLEGLTDSAAIIDCFTPKTIERFTGRTNGAVLGSPEATRTGQTSIKNLFLCGTDQGFLGITGSLFSGISIAELNLL
ncbi:NAD(P)/FAD-dependent oxidoreductase [Lentisphaerota bacterium ZTH]|nr:NAD(P)/FAD-dependent oxidoreductase [Lentisphaerota bacterium]WET05290.1 NAD(P)/FAD-dependent oxidoreductase [Lentisphaerota bacterium ZTH]